MDKQYLDLAHSCIECVFVCASISGAFASECVCVGVWCVCCGVEFSARGLSADLTHITRQHTHTYTEALTDAAPQMAQMQIARLKVRLRLDADGDGDGNGVGMEEEEEVREQQQVG